MNARPSPFTLEDLARAEALWLQRRAEIATGKRKLGIVQDAPGCSEGCDPCAHRCAIMVRCIEAMRRDLAAEAQVIVATRSATVH